MSEYSVPGTIIDEDDWMICSKLEEFVHIGWATKWHTNVPCFLCLWGSRACQEQWARESWPKKDL